MWAPALVSSSHDPDNRTSTGIPARLEWEPDPPADFLGVALAFGAADRYV
jgi:hypothetical protein